MTKKTISRVLDVKGRMRDVRRSELADAAKKVENAELRATRAARVTARAIRAVTEMGEIPARDLANRSALVALASQDEKGARAMLHNCIEERSRCRAVLQEADREVRMFDVLQQRFIRYDIRKERAREQRDCDEAAIRTRNGR
jgi:flagellar export protein FliJ